MLIKIEKIEGGHLAYYELPLKHSVDKVWGAITQNEKLVWWMPNLQIVNLKKDGIIKFNMNDGSGSSFEIKIIDYRKQEVLEYQWGEGWVNFKLYPKSDGSLLVFKEFIKSINDHTSKDLAGWHVCLDVLSDLLNGKYHTQFPKENWEILHQKYFVSVKKLSN